MVIQALHIGADVDDMAAQFSYFHRTIKSTRRSAVPSVLISAVFLVVSVIPDLLLYSWSSNLHSYHLVVSVRSSGSNLTLRSWHSLHYLHIHSQTVCKIFSGYLSLMTISVYSLSAVQLHILMGTLASLSGCSSWFDYPERLLPTDERIRYTRCS